MTKIVKWWWLAAAALFTSAAMAQQPPATAGQAELDQILAPIALYPDSLLSQILMAATYPQDLAEAASWSRTQEGLRGDQAVRAVEDRDWDPSVVSLAAFPEVLAMMDERRDWTARLGDAFLAQPDAVMDTVQQLRARADAAGNLRTTEEMVVQRQGEDYLIEPPAPDYVSVPYYDPRVVYGDWWWPAYQPVYWNPWPGYGFASYGFRWGPRVRLGSGFFFGSFDWRHRYLRYGSHRPWYYHGRDYRGGGRWARGDDHRRDGRDRGNWRADREGRGDRDGRADRAGRGNGEARGAREGRGEGRQWRAPARSNGAVNAAQPGQQGFFAARPESARSRDARVDAQRVESRRIAGQRFEAQRIESQRTQAANPGTRAAAPRYGIEGGRGQVRREAPQARSAGAAPQAAPSRSYVERAPTQRTQPQVERAPVARPQVERPAAPSGGGVERGASPRTERAAPAQREQREQREPGGGGHRGGGRDR